MQGIGRPSTFHTLTESFRAACELATFIASLPVLKRVTSDGLGKPVLVIPGFTANDVSTLALRTFLKEKNYKVYGWENGFNLRVNTPTVRHLVGMVDRIQNENEGSRVNIIGHSLGGIMGRELARYMPGKINQVITIGSPFGSTKHEDSSMPFLREVITYLSPQLVEIMEDESITPWIVPPEGVPTTSIYTKGDGIVHWKTCLNPPTPGAENIEVPCSCHVGLIFNPLTMYILANRLQQQKENWKPYSGLLVSNARADTDFASDNRASCFSCLDGCTPK